MNFKQALLYGNFCVGNIIRNLARAPAVKSRLYNYDNGAGKSIIEVKILIYLCSDCKNNRFQNKLIRQKANI